MGKRLTDKWNADEVPFTAPGDRPGFPHTPQGPVRAAVLIDAATSTVIGSVWADRHGAAGYRVTPGATGRHCGVWAGGVLRGLADESQPADAVLTAAGRFAPAYRLGPVAEGSDVDAAATAAAASYSTQA